MRRSTWMMVLMSLGILSDACVDPYNPSVTTRDVHYLVVEGFLNATDGICKIKLSRTIPLTSSEVPFEEDANVELQDEDGGEISLTGGANGEYAVENLILDLSKKYRITIATSDEEEYASEFVSIVQTPAIDSVSWGTDRRGVPIYVSSHGDENSSFYYRWKYTETWQYSSAWNSRYKIVSDTVAPRNNSPEEAIYKCWRTEDSHEIIVSSSNLLGENIISQFMMVTIPWNSPRLQRKYSVLVEQQGITKEAFEYWQLLKKNTEEMGTLFDPLPASVLGNIKCTSNAKKIVLGYFNCSTVSKQRIYIDETEIDWPSGTSATTGYEDCPLYTILTGQSYGGLIPIDPAFDVSNQNKFIGYLASTKECVDCRFAGGVNVKPDFFEE